MSLQWYFHNIRDEESAAAFLHEKGVFHRERSCRSCHQQMELCSSRNRLRLDNAIGLILAWSDKPSSMRFCKKHLGTPSAAHNAQHNQQVHAITDQSRGLLCITRHQLQSQM
ncbi:hypothetical protein M513_11624 [Trichuris suis]|uniref:Uncharacterized protein n=1 Tax=Trichuris suis TaxID=68888 RepID=A0A085LR67_9BILA|nr:hypothetical protein M513_11624 [Trichuris suis]